METKKIKILVQTKKTSEGRSFNAYKTTSKNGRLMDVKFRKEVKELPTENCYAIINVDNMNIDKNREYPVLWVKEVEGYEDLETNSKENNKKVLDEFFA